VARGKPHREQKRISSDGCFWLHFGQYIFSSATSATVRLKVVRTSVQQSSHEVTEGEPLKDERLLESLRLTEGMQQSPRSPLILIQ